MQTINDKTFIVLSFINNCKKFLVNSILSSDKIDTGQVCKFNINRSAVLDGAILGFRRLSCDPNKIMSIKFSDDRGTKEKAVAAAESDTFEGPKGHLNLALSSSGAYIRIFLQTCNKGVLF